MYLISITCICLSKSKFYYRHSFESVSSEALLSFWFGERQSYSEISMAFEFIYSFIHVVNK